MNINEFEEYIIGKSLEDCEVLAKKYGFVIRPKIVDGNIQIVTLDFCMDRVNVETDNGIITKVLRRG